MYVSSKKLCNTLSISYKEKISEYHNLNLKAFNKQVNKIKNQKSKQQLELN